MKKETWKKQKEFLVALQKLKREAGIQNIFIKEISLPSYWVDYGDVVSDKLLGIKIK